jgi:DNA-binding transcriptional LysR family regulator
MRLRKVRHKLKGATGQTGANLSFACQHAIATTVSPWIVRALTTDNDASVRVRSCNQEECLMLLLSGEVDFGVMYTVPGESTPFIERAFETLTLGGDTLIPVCAPALRDTVQLSQIPGIIYPSGVFLGQVFDRNIAPGIKAGIQIVTKAETALTLAAYEFALGGIGVAWLPRSMVVEALGRGALISLETDLPVQPLEIKAFRLSEGGVGASEPAWHDILTKIALPDHLKRHSDASGT